MRYTLFTLLIITLFVLFACGTQTNYQGQSQDNQYTGGGCGVAHQNDVLIDCSVHLECLLTTSVGNAGL